MGELYVDDKLVAKLQGTGELHPITLSSGFSASTAQWCVRNGICMVEFGRLKASSTGTNKVVCTGLPKAKYYAYISCTDDFGGSVMFISTTPNSGTLVANVNNTNNCYVTFIYVVADDWEET